VPYGPEQWQGEWTWWDLWFCVVCLADADGDWDGLDARLGEPDLEAKWRHLVDLRSRLSAAGLSPADLAGDVYRDVKVRSRARTKVQRSHLYPRDLTPAMKDTPNRRMRRRALFGHWPSYAVSPQTAYDELWLHVDGGDDFDEDSWPDEAQITTSQAQSLARAVSLTPVRDADELLAVRRAALTVAYELHETGDDSDGVLGEVGRDAVMGFAQAPWRRSGTAAPVVLGDLLEFVCFEDYGMTGFSGVAVMAAAGAATHLDLMEQVLARLEEGYRQARMRYAAMNAVTFLAYAQVAAGAVDRFHVTASRLDPVEWPTRDAMIGAALTVGKVEVAQLVLESAGSHMDFLRTRWPSLARLCGN